MTRRGVLGLAVAVFLVVSLVGWILGMPAPAPLLGAQPAAASGLSQNRTTTDESPVARDGSGSRTDATATGEDSTPGSPIPGQPIALRVPSVGLETALGTLTVEPGTAVNPPTARIAYWLSDYGVAGTAADNTVYVVGHSFRDGGAVFNALLDPDHEQSALAVGDLVQLDTTDGSYDYAVSAVARYDKTAVGDEEELWRRVPGRLVLVTCFQRDDGRASTQNLIVYADLVR